MERDALISAGLTQFLKEKFMDYSDGHTAKGLYTVVVCGNCGLFAQQNQATNEYKCRSPDCQDRNNVFKQIYLPYSMKLFIQELQGMCIATRIFCDELSL